MAMIEIESHAVERMYEDRGRIDGYIDITLYNHQIVTDTLTRIVVARHWYWSGRMR